ncbi:MAG: hypothetical protein GTN90_11010 [Xanthomonadales bacterium]|nr:hypothetical protein [Xanthomonadales bacterium]
MMGAVWAAVAYRFGFFHIPPLALIVSIVIALAIAWLTGHLAVNVARRLNVIRLIDTLAATIVMITALNALIVFNSQSGIGDQMIADIVLKSAALGTIAALTGWFYAFGRRWSVRTDAL